MGIALASRRRRKSAAPVDWARPTQERMNRADDDMVTDDQKRRWMRDSPFERAFSRNIINGRQYFAGQKYYHHWYHSGLSDPLSSVDLERVFASDLAAFSHMPRSEAQAHSRQQYRLAQATLGMALASFLERLICRETPMETLGYELGWANAPQARAAATERLRLALDKLIEMGW